MARERAYLEAAEAAAESIADVEADISAIGRNALPVVPEGTADSALDPLLLQRKAELDDATSARTRINERITLLPSEISKTRARIEQLSVLAPTDATALQSAQLSVEKARLRTMETELSTLATRQGLVLSQHRLAKVRYERLREFVSAQAEERNSDRLSRHAVFADQLRSGINNRSNSEPDMFDKETLRLLGVLTDVLSVAVVLNDEALLIDVQSQRLVKSLETVQRVFAIAEPDTPTVALLRRIRDTLPTTETLQVRLDESRATLADYELRSILWSEEMDGLDQQQTRDSSAVANRREVLERLQSAVREDAERRTRSNLELSTTIATTETLRTDLDRRLLWMRSKDDTFQDWLARTPAGVAWLLRPTHWAGAITAFMGGLAQRPVASMLLGLLTVLLWALRPRMSKRTADLSDRVGTSRDGYWVTPFAVLIDILRALALPAIFVWVAFVIASGLLEGATSLTAQLPKALLGLAVLLFFLLVFLKLAQAEGTLRTHFGWSESSRLSVARHLRWFIPLLVTGAFVISLVRQSDQVGIQNGLDLLLFILLSVAMAVLAWAFLNPKDGIVSRIVPQTPGAPWLKLALVAAVVAPLAVGLLPLLGWIDTAREFQSRIFSSGYACLLVTLIYSLLKRTVDIAVARHRSAPKEAARVATPLTETGGAGVTPEPVPQTLAGPERFYSALPWVAVALLFWLLWSEWRSLVPAFGILDDIELWSASSMVDGEVVTQSTTVSTVLVSIGVFLLSLFAARHAKGAFSLMAGRGLKMDAGTRYAAATIASYVALGLGAVIALGMLGLDWSKLQWIVAALGVGLGFGLQEIVANFVSGIIILFERPVRVGDIVTINNLSGTVRDVRIRATMITDFDNRDVLLPNKSIITGEVTNWTLHDSVTRLVIPIGVAYGTDIPSVTKLLERVIAEQPDILAHPEPSVIMTNHGDSSLDFELRVFVETPAHRLPVTHELNASINVELKAAQIEIPFPQHDVWHRNANSHASDKPL